MHFIPSFPDFCRFDLKFADTYNEVYSRLKPYCDLSINDLIIWFDHNKDLEISQLNGNFVLKFSNVFDDDKTNFVIVGNQKANDTLYEVFKYQHSHHHKIGVTNISEDFVEALGKDYKDMLDVEPEPENKDYIFNVANNIRMEGRKYEKLRYKINHFTRHYGDVLRIDDMPMSQLESKKKLVNALHTWDKLYAKDQKLKIKYEGVAINRHLLLASDIPVFCVTVSVDGKLVGFSIYHIPPQRDYAIGNHIKCDYSYRYIFDYMYYVTLLSCRERGIKYVNGEQDLGDQGIRKHKEEMLPEFFLQRFSITPKNEVLAG